MSDHHLAATKTPPRRAGGRPVLEGGIPLLLGGVVVLGMANINAFVDLLLHPDIPYFDPEHLIVGGITAFVSAALIAGLAFYLRSLASAEERIKKLESFSAICMYCKRVKLPSSPSDRMESWDSVESFLLRRFDVRFSHGMCPECAGKQSPP